MAIWARDEAVRANEEVEFARTKRRTRMRLMTRGWQRSRLP